VLDPGLVLLSGRVQWIAEQEQPERGHRVLVGADDERAVPTPHRPAAQHELLRRQLGARRELSGGLARGGIEHRRPVR